MVMAIVSLIVNVKAILLVAQASISSSIVPHMISKMTLSFCYDNITDGKTDTLKNADRGILIEARVEDETPDGDGDGDWRWRWRPRWSAE